MARGEIEVAEDCPSGVIRHLVEENNKLVRVLTDVCRECAVPIREDEMPRIITIKKKG